MTATNRPVWQTKPCPSWCATVHHSADHPGARRCEDVAGRTILSLEESLSAGAGKWIPDEMTVSMEQPTTGNSDPSILLYFANGEGRDLTLDEAETIAHLILSRVMEARNGKTLKAVPMGGKAS